MSLDVYQRQPSSRMGRAEPKALGPSRDRWADTSPAASELSHEATPLANMRPTGQRSSSLPRTRPVASDFAGVAILGKPADEAARDRYQRVDVPRGFCFSFGASGFCKKGAACTFTHVDFRTSRPTTATARDRPGPRDRVSSALALMDHPPPKPFVASAVTIAYPYGLNDPHRAWTTPLPAAIITAPGPAPAPAPSPPGGVGVGAQILRILQSPKGDPAGDAPPAGPNSVRLPVVFHSPPHETEEAAAARIKLELRDLERRAAALTEELGRKERGAAVSRALAGRAAANAALVASQVAARATIDAARAEADAAFSRVRAAAAEREASLARELAAAIGAAGAATAATQEAVKVAAARLDALITARPACVVEAQAPPQDLESARAALESAAAALATAGPDSSLAPPRIAIDAAALTALEVALAALGGIVPVAPAPESVASDDATAPAVGEGAAVGVGEAMAVTMPVTPAKAAKGAKGAKAQAKNGEKAKGPASAPAAPAAAPVATPTPSAVVTPPAAAAAVSAAAPAPNDSAIVATPTPVAAAAAKAPVTPTPAVPPGLALVRVSGGESVHEALKAACLASLAAAAARSPAAAAVK